MKTLLLLTALSLSVVGNAVADGCFFLPPDVLSTHAGSSSAQKGILLREGADEVLLLQTTYHGPASRFAWIIPVPVQPQVFLAEAAFVEQVFVRSEPRVVTDLGTDSWLVDKFNMSAGMKAAGPAAPPGGGPGAVQVLQRMLVGDFEAAVLAAGDGNALRQWLLANRYAVPRDPEGVLGAYARQGWVFVALRMQDEAAETKPQLADVPPVGLRFPYPPGKLIFPLSISRLSAPAQSAILLCTIGDAPYLCDTLPTRFVDATASLKRGETYGTLRRKLSREPGPGTLCEASRTGALPYTDLNYDSTQTAKTNFPQAHLTRHFLLLQPGEMQDLVFSAKPDDPHRDYQLLISRKGRLRKMDADPSELRSLVLEPGSGEQATARGQAAPAVETSSVLGLTGPAADGIMLLVVLAALTVVILLFRNRGSSEGCGTMFLFAIGLMILGGTLSSLNHEYARYAGRADGLTQRLEGAATNFREDTGANPKTVEDLAAIVAPATGYDASGNEVPVQGWKGPYLRYAPADPTGGTMIVDPLNTQLIDVGGLTATVRAVPQATLTRLFPRDRFSASYTGPRGSSAASGRPTPAFWKTSEATMQFDLKPYRDWVMGSEVSRLWVGRRAPHGSGGARYGWSFVVDHQRLRGIAIRPPKEGGTVVDVGADGLQARLAVAFTDNATQKTTWVSGLAGPASVPQSKLHPKLPVSAQLLRVAPGAQTMLVCQELFGSQACLLDRQGNTTLLTLDDGWPETAAFSPDGTRLYLIQRPRGSDDEDPHCQLTILAVPSGKSVGTVSGVYRSTLSVGKAGVVVAASEALWLVSPDGVKRSLCALPAGQTVYAAALADHCVWAACGPPIDYHAKWGTVYRVPLQSPALKPVAHYLAFSTAEIIMAGANDTSVGGAWGWLEEGRWGYWLLRDGRAVNVTGESPDNNPAHYVPKADTYPAAPDKLPLIPPPGKRPPHTPSSTPPLTFDIPPR